MNFGLALSGGGTRGAAHVGVLMALAEADLMPTSIAGTSAGSIVAGLYASGVSIDEMERTVRLLSKKGYKYLDPDILGILKYIPQMIAKHPIQLSGLIKGDKLLNLFRELTQGKMISEAFLTLVIPTVDIKSGKTIAYTNGRKLRRFENVEWEKEISICEAMIASSSVPAIFCPRNIGKYSLVDGGVTNVLPVDLLMGTGENTIIAIDIGDPYETPRRCDINEVISHSMSIMSHWLKDCTSSGERLLLQPKLPEKAGLLTFEYMEECMEEGYGYTKKKIQQIRREIA